MAELRYLANVVTLGLEEQKCVGCGRCVEVCPHGVFVVEEGKARIVDQDGCMECGACAKNCPVEAVSVEAGVGCAAAVIRGALRRTGPECGCGGSDESSCCRQSEDPGVSPEAKE